MSGLAFYLSLEHSYLFAECREHLQAEIDSKLEGFARGAALKAARHQLLLHGEGVEGVGVEGVESSEVEGELEVSAHFERCCLSSATGLYDGPGAGQATSSTVAASRASSLLLAPLRLHRLSRARPACLCPLPSSPRGLSRPSRSATSWVVAAVLAPSSESHTAVRTLERPPSPPPSRAGARAVEQSPVNLKISRMLALASRPRHHEVLASLPAIGETDAAIAATHAARQPTGKEPSSSPSSCCWSGKRAVAGPSRQTNAPEEGMTSEEDMVFVLSGCEGEDTLLVQGVVQRREHLGGARIVPSNWLTDESDGVDV